MKDMDINYPAYVWTHNGWIQKMDVAYNEHQWDTEPLIVHVVPFSHNDPGLCVVEYGIILIIMYCSLSSRLASCMGTVICRHLQSSGGKQDHLLISGCRVPAP